MSGQMKFFKDFEELKNHLANTLKSIGLDELANIATDEDLENICTSYISVEGVLQLTQEEMHVELLKVIILSMLSYARINHGIDGSKLFLGEIYG